MEQEASKQKEGFEQFSGQKYLVLESYRRNGETVKTLVWFVENHGTLYIWTASDTGKAKRIRRNRVRIAPSNSRGILKGRWVEAIARPVGDEDAEQAQPLLKGKYGLQYRMIRSMSKLSGKPRVVIAIRAPSASNQVSSL